MAKINHNPFSKKKKNQQQQQQQRAKNLLSTSPANRSNLKIVVIQNNYKAP